MRKIIVGMAVLAQALLPMAASAQSVGTMLNSVDSQALQQRGQALATGMQSQAPVFNADGTLARDSSGTKAQQAPSSKQSITGQAAYFQNLTGIQTYQATATPGRGNAAGAQVSAAQGADFSCNTLGQRKSIASQIVVLNSCSGSVSAVQSLAVSVCSALTAGGSCDKVAHPESFTDYVVPVGAWTSVPNGSMGASCTASGVCRITIQATLSAGGDADTLKQKAQAQAALGGSNTLSASAQKIVDSKTDAQRQTAITTRDCFLQNQDRMTQGLPLLTCDGQKEAGISGQPTSAAASTDTSTTSSCNTSQRTCVREATQTVTYTRSCTRTFPMTEYDCPWTVPTKACTITVTPSPVGGLTNGTNSSASSAPALTTGLTSTASSASTTTSSCSDSDIADAVKVSSTQGVCDSSGNCNTASWVDTYVFPKQAAQTGTCTVYPTALAGAAATSCANHGTGTITGCADGGWVGRTLDDSQCNLTTNTTLADGSIAQSNTALTYAEKAGCGYCAHPVYADTCYAQASETTPADSCGAIPAGCQLTSATPQSSVAGLTTAQTETYTCTQQETSCVQYQAAANCTVNLSQGQDHAPTSLSNMASFNQAMASAAVMAAIEKSAKDSGNPALPKIFNGADMRCRTPTGFLSGLLLNDCCKISLDHPGGHHPMHKCTDNEVKLAAARRANQTVYIGDYCSRKVGFWKAKKCVETTQTYCSFDGVLSRLIQGQGRQQLLSMVTSGFGATQSSQVSFPYYKDQGGWGQPTTVNGVTVVPFQYPSYCADGQRTVDALAANPNGIVCPNVLTQWFATCDKNACGDLPLVPELGSDSWLIEQVDPLKNALQAVSRTASVEGACDPSTTQCSYKVTAWPAASGGKAMVTRDWTFNLYAPDATSANDMFSLGDTLFRPHPLVGTSDGSTLPASLTLEYSPDYGVTWSSMALPTRTSGDGINIPGTDTLVAGSCDAASNACAYKATGTVTATLKPWGWPENPDCSGFTPAQISVMDFSKMDLSEWIAQVMGKIQPPDSAQLGQLATQQTSDFYNSMATGGSQTATNPMRTEFAHVSPTEAMGPFNAQLYTSAYWPVAGASPDQHSDRISSVLIDWGDCTLSTMADYASEVAANGSLAEAFVASHTYVAPNKLVCGAAESSVVHTVHLTITAKSGVHYTDLKVTNQWNTLTGQTVGLGESTGGAAQNKVSAPLPGQNPNK